MLRFVRISEVTFSTCLGSLTHVMQARFNGGDVFKAE